MGEQPTPRPRCPICGRKAAPKAYLLMGYCSRVCMADAQGETGSEVEYD